MPRTPTGAKRPADVIGNAVLVMKIATGEFEDAKPAKATEGNRKGGMKGGPARATKLTASRRTEIAKKAAAGRWKKPKAKSK